MARHREGARHLDPFHAAHRGDQVPEVVLALAQRVRRVLEDGPMQVDV